MALINRRKLLVGLGAAIAAPAVVHAASLMPVRGIVMDVTTLDVLSAGGGYATPQEFYSIVHPEIWGALQQRVNRCSQEVLQGVICSFESGDIYAPDAR